MAAAAMALAALLIAPSAALAQSSDGAATSAPIRPRLIAAPAPPSADVEAPAALGPRPRLLSAPAKPAPAPAPPSAPGPSSDARGTDVFTKNFTIFNDGTASLSVTNVTVENTSSWLSVTPPSSFPVSVGNGSSALFTARVTDSGLPNGTYQDRLVVASNDPDENPSFVTVIYMKTGGGGMATKPFTIFNDGNATLNVTGIAKQNNANWVTVAPPSGFPLAIGAGSSATVNVTVDLGLAGASASERLLVSSNDPDENPYPNGVFINVTGAAPTAQEVVNGILGVAAAPAGADQNSNSRVEVGDVIIIVNSGR